MTPNIKNSFRAKSILLFFSLLITACGSIKPKYNTSSGNKNHDIWFKKLIAENNDLKVMEIDKENSSVAKSQISKKSKFLKDIHSNKVNFWVNYFGVENKERFQRFIDNGEKYRPIIEEIFAQHKLPKELYFVGLIESGYYLGNKSHAGAMGPWQFMRSTAKMFDLTVNRYIDERRNIIKSTHAAALYYKDLYNIFGSWELALAAYNKGENGIIRRIRKGNTRDYYKLCEMKLLPKETRNYVPKVIAAMKVYTNAKKYGLEVTKVDSTIYKNTKTIKIRKSMRISSLAQKLNIDLDTLKMLNPELISRYTPNLRNSIELYVPNREYDQNLLAGLQIKEKRIHSGRSKRSRKSISKSNLKKINYYSVKRGDNLYELAKNFNTTIADLKNLNNLNRNTVYVGQKLKLPGVKLKTYTVKRGDNITAIANKFGLRPAKIININGLDKATIYPGQKIIIALN